MKLNAHQTAALAKLQQDGVLYGFNGISIATARVLAQAGHGTLHTKITTAYGLTGRGRGLTYVDWHLTKKES